MMSETLSKFGVNNFYKYKEVVKDKKTVEFGWEECEGVEPGASVVLSRSSTHPHTDSAVALEDYHKYFTSLTGLEPAKFLGRWKNSEKEFEKYWNNSKTNSPKGTHEFVFKLAFLIQNKESFEYKFSDRLVTFEVVDVKDESSGSQKRDKD